MMRIFVVKIVAASGTSLREQEHIARSAARNGLFTSFFDLLTTKKSPACEPGFLYCCNRCALPAYYQICGRSESGRTIGSPGLHPNAFANSGMFASGPLTRQRAGAWGSVSTCCRSASGRAFVRQTCAHERKNRCSGVKPSIEAGGARRVDVRAVESVRGSHCAISGGRAPIRSA
jgi:hypothetical protein